MQQTVCQERKEVLMFDFFKTYISWEPETLRKIHFVSIKESIKL